MEFAETMGLLYHIVKLMVVKINEKKTVFVSNMGQMFYDVKLMVAKINV